jgi:hypothetical protein
MSLERWSVMRKNRARVEQLLALISGAIAYAGRAKDHCQCTPGGHPQGTPADPLVNLLRRGVAVMPVDGHPEQLVIELGADRFKLTARRVGWARP